MQRPQGLRTWYIWGIFYSAPQEFRPYFKGNSEALKILTRGKPGQGSRMVFRDLPEIPLWRMNSRESLRLKKEDEVYPSEKLGVCGEGDDEANESRDWFPFNYVSYMVYTIYICE